MRLCVLLIPLLFTLANSLGLTETVSGNTTVYIACYEALDKDNNVDVAIDISGEDGIIGVEQDASEVYGLCEDAAFKRGYTVFAIYRSYDGTKCYTSASAADTFDMYGKAEDQDMCDGSSGLAMSVYQIVANRAVSIPQDSWHELECSSRTGGMITVLEAVLGCSAASESVMDEVEGQCQYLDMCWVDHDLDSYYVESCEGDQQELNVTYGCLYFNYEYDDDDDYDKGFDFGEIVGKYFRFIVFIGFVIIAVISAYRYRYRLQQVPWLREPCLKLHSCCPCLNLYPPGAAPPGPAGQGQVYPPPPTTWGQPPPGGWSQQPPPPRVTENPVGYVTNMVSNAGNPVNYNYSAETQDLPPPPAYNELNKY